MYVDIRGAISLARNCSASDGRNGDRSLTMRSTSMRVPIVDACYKLRNRGACASEEIKVVGYWNKSSFGIPPPEVMCLKVPETKCAKLGNFGVTLGFGSSMWRPIDGQFMKKNRGPFNPNSASQSGMKASKREIFDEEYRVVAVESQSLTVQGVRSGKVLTIVNHNPETPLTPEEYPQGKLIKLSDPSASQAN